jgi:hypothetical protein
MNSGTERGAMPWLPHLILAGLLALPAFWVVRLEVFPFTDLPNHLAAATIYRHLDDPATQFAEYFASDVSVLKPNIAHIVFCSAFPSVEGGNRVWLLLMLATLGVSMSLLFRVTKANPALLPLTVLLVFNANLSWGFIGFAFAVPLLIGLAVAVLLLLRRPSFGAGTAVSVLLILLFYAHVFALLFGLLFAMLAALLDTRGRLVRGLRAVGMAALPAAILFCGWIVSGEEFRGNPTIEYLIGYYRWHYAGSLLPRAGLLLTHDNVALVSDRSAVPLTGLFSLALVSGLGLLLRSGDRARFWNTDGSRVVFAFLGAACLCFAGLPNAMPGVVPVYARFSVLVVAGALMVTSLTLPAGRTTLVLLLASIVACMYIAVWHLYFSDFERSSRDFSREFLTHAGGSSSVVAAMIRDPEFRGLRPLLHFNNYHTIWNLGITPTKMAEYRFGAIRPKPGGRSLPEYQEWISPDAGLGGLLARYAAARFILYHGPREEFHRVAGEGLEEVARSGSWAIYGRIPVR